MRLKNLFINSIPIAIGYGFLGFTFGLVWVQKGGDTLTSFIISLFSFAGSSQFMALEFLGSNYNPWFFFLSIFVLTIRHIFYGLSCLNLFGSWSLRKIYLIGALTDENFGMIQYYKRREGTTPTSLFKIFIVNHFYWVAGCTSGAFLSSIFAIKIKGLEFSLIALFIVMSIESIKDLKTKLIKTKFSNSETLVNEN